MNNLVFTSQGPSIAVEMNFDVRLNSGSYMCSQVLVEFGITKVKSNLNSYNNLPCKKCCSSKRTSDIPSEETDVRTA